MKSILHHSTEYKLVAEHYGERKASRSGVRLMQHIHEGVAVLETIGATVGAICGFMLHPLVQGQLDMEMNLTKICRQEMLNTRGLMMVMEYRHKANSYLCTEATDGWSDYDARQAIGELCIDVRDMLIADKVQNYKDFLVYHHGTHPRTLELQNYFQRWFRLLDITEKEYLALALVMGAV